MTAVPVLQLTEVSKSFTPAEGEPVPVLIGASLTLMPGQQASLIGVSGAGKSTLLSLISGLLRPDSGTVEIDGQRLVELSEGDRAAVRARRVGIALQADNLIAWLSARENVELALSLGRRVRRRAAGAAAMELLDRFDVADQAGQLPRRLSGGEAQRVALAVALANRPALLLADEVVAQLDADTAGRVVDEVLATDTAVLYVTHDMALADRAAIRYELVDHQVRPR